MRVREFSAEDAGAWENFTRGCPSATLFHRLAWREIISSVFGHRSVYLLAEDTAGLCGILPLVILRTRFFGRMAVSLPFLNYGGVVATNDEAAAALLAAAERVGRETDCAYVEYRHRYSPPAAQSLPLNDFKVTTRLDLSAGAQALWTERLHQNVRNKIRKAEKQDVQVVGGNSGVDDFYRVFASNQRDHGTPVLPKKWFKQIAAAFGQDARFYLARHAGRTIGAKLVLDFKDTCYFIWSASLREANHLAPVPAMNWLAIQEAAARGVRFIDLGRSTKGSGSQNFKKYWGGEIEPLYWHYHLLTRDSVPGLNAVNPKFARAIGLWRKLPVAVTRWIGPWLARDLP